jgi:hypothetical protein
MFKKLIICFLLTSGCALSWGQWSGLLQIALGNTTVSGYQVYEFPFTQVNPGDTHRWRANYSTNGVPDDVAQQGIGWKIRTYTNHTLYSGYKYQKPIIVTQGFEPDWGFDPDDFDDNEAVLGMQPSSTSSILKYFYNNGYEVVLVRYKNPNSSITLNSWAFQGAIQHVFNNLASPSTQIRIIGPSMGGLIARYTIQHMIERMGSNAPNISHFIAFDSPNRGAVIPPSVQSFLFYAGYHNSSDDVYQRRNNLLSPAAKEMLLYYISPKDGYGRESDMGFQTITDYEDPNSDHGRFMADINNLESTTNLNRYHTYCQNSTDPIRLTAIANGSGNNTDFGLPQDTRIMHLFAEKEASECPWYTGWCGGVSPDVADMDLYTGYAGILRRVYYGDIDGWGSSSGQDAWEMWFNEPVFIENAPGSNRDSYRQIAKSWDAANEDKYNMEVTNFDSKFKSGHAFIPTMSALGLRKENGWDANYTESWYRDFLSEKSSLWYSSIFGNLYIPSENQPHMTINSQTMEWIVSELESPFGMAVTN